MITWYEYRCTCGVLICTLSQEQLDAAIKRHKCKVKKAA